MNIHRNVSTRHVRFFRIGTKRTETFRPGCAVRLWPSSSGRFPAIGMTCKTRMSVSLSPLCAKLTTDRDEHEAGMRIDEMNPSQFCDAPTAQIQVPSGHWGAIEERTGTITESVSSWHRSASTSINGVPPDLSTASSSCPAHRAWRCSNACV